MIAAVIVTYNGEKWITAAVESLWAADSVEVVIVVDNCSSDRTRERIAGWPKTLLISKSSNIGFGRANNEGISEALRRGAEHILLLNQDAKLAPDCAAILSQVMKRNPEYGIVSPVHLTYDRANIDEYFIQYMTAAPAIISDIYFRRTKEIYEVPFVNAATWLVSRRVFERMGGFDPLFFLYAEDSDFCRRIRDCGFKVGIVPAATTFHWHMVREKSALSLRDRKNWEFSGLVYDLKRPDRGFLKNLAWVAFQRTGEVMHSILTCNIKGCMAAALAGMICFFKIATIRRHYLQSKTEGPHWLDIAPKHGLNTLERKEIQAD
jgi:GT2 family glycosyltransferase